MYPRSAEREEVLQDKLMVMMMMALTVERQHCDSGHIQDLGTVDTCDMIVWQAGK
jgi:hypothetical protein